MQIQTTKYVQTPQSPLFPLSPESVRQLLESKDNLVEGALPARASSAEDI